MQAVMINGVEYRVNEVCECCGEPKSVITDEGSVRDVDCLCDRVDKAKKRQVFYDKLGGLTIRKTSTLENFKPKEEIDFEIQSMVKEYIEKFPKILTMENDEEGKGIMLVGNSGTGKTFACSCIVNTMNERGYTYLAMNLNRYLEILRPNSGEDYTQSQILKAVKDVDLLFIDDLGSEYINRQDNKKWAISLINELFDARINANKPILITSNLQTGDEVREHLHFDGTDTTSSRLLGMMRGVLRHTGKDKRLANKKFAKGF